MRARCSNLAAGACERVGDEFDSQEGQNFEIEDAVVNVAIERDRVKELALLSLYLLSLYMQRTYLPNKAKRPEKEYRDKHYPVEIARASGKAA